MLPFKLKQYGRKTWWRIEDGREARNTNRNTNDCGRKYTDKQGSRNFLDHKYRRQKNTEASKKYGWIMKIAQANKRGIIRCDNPCTFQTNESNEKADAR